MKTVGLIGGMSWQSTATYYRIVNETVAERRGEHASAKIAMQSLDFAEVRDLQVDGDWDGVAALLVEAARRCVAGGATQVAICSNRMHRVVPEVERALDVPLLHMGDAVAAEAEARGWRTLGILGSEWVMSGSFYADRLARRGISAVSLSAADRQMVDAVIFDELTQGVVRDTSRAAYVDVVHRLAEQGADGVVLACTEIGMLLGPGNSPLPLMDSVEAHARAIGLASADRPL